MEQTVQTDTPKPVVLVDVIDDGVEKLFRVQAPGLRFLISEGMAAELRDALAGALVLEDWERLARPDSAAPQRHRGYSPRDGGL